MQNEFFQFRLFLVKLLLPSDVHLTESEKPKRWGREQKGDRGGREGERKMGKEEEGKEEEGKEEERWGRRKKGRRKKDGEATGYFCR